MLSIHQQTETRQQQTLSPRLQRAVWLLQLSSTDFAHEVQSVLGRNPFLEPDEGDEPASGCAGLTPEHLADSHLADSRLADMPADPGGAGGEPASATFDLADPIDPARAGLADAGPELLAASAYDTGDDPDAADTGELGVSGLPGESGEHDIWTADGLPRSRRTDDGEMSALDLMAWEPTLAAQLHRQLDLLQLPERDALLARAVVESLDDDGYLRIPLQEVADAAWLQPPAGPAEMKIALARVQSLEPAGVAARSVAECLQLQLPAIECAKTRELARRIIGEHMGLLARHDAPRLARELGRPLADVEQACDRIRRLDPRPGWRCGPSPVHYVVPDVVVRRWRGRWTVQLNSAVVPRVRMNRVYAELFQRHRRAEDQALAEHLKEARWTLRNVEQRFATIMQVAQAIVDRQHQFLDHGPMAMRPLGLKEIADTLGLHESTVSRVTSNKYMMTPMGVFELKYFFSRALTTDSGKTCSGTAVRSLIKDMIDAESPANPLSDADIARLLARQGVRLARRTVTKYRQLLRIDPIDRRRGRSPAA